MDTFRGPVNNKLDKKTLILITEALGLATAGTKEALIPRIKQHLKVHPELAQDQRFQGLYSYRPQANESQIASRKSSDKAEDERLEPAKLAEDATGANQTLIKMKQAVDPPAQFIQLGERTAPTKPSGLPTRQRDRRVSDDESSSEDSRSSLAGNQHDDAAVDCTTKSLGKTNINPSADLPIVVNLFDFADERKAPTEIWLPGGVDVNVKEEGGRTVYTTSLSKLLPEVMRVHTPMKSKGGRVYRTGHLSRSSRIDLGLVDTLLSGESRSLAVKKVDTYELAASDQGHLQCDIFLDVGMSQAGPHVKPLEVATARVAASRSTAKALKSSSCAVDEEFITYLRKVLKTGDTNWGRAETARDAANRYKHLEDVLAQLRKFDWGMSKGGYRVPVADNQEYAGQTFVRADVYTDMRIPHSTIGEDGKLFGAASIMNATKVKEWLADPDGRYGEDFNKMKLAHFKKYLKDQDEKARLEARVEERRLTDERK